MWITVESANSLDTSAIRRMFSDRSSAEKPKFRLRPCRTLSPSKRYDRWPSKRNRCSRARAMVDLPDAESPVSQMVKPYIQ